MIATVNVFLRVRPPVDRLRRLAQLGRLDAHGSRAPAPSGPAAPWFYSGSLLNLGVLLGGLTAALLSREFAIRVRLPAS